MNTDNLSMTSFTSAYSFIGWIGYLTSSIPALYFTNTSQSLQYCLDAPETSSTDNGLTNHIFCSEILYSDILISHLISSSLIITNPNFDKTNKKIPYPHKNAPTKNKKNNVNRLTTNRQNLNNPLPTKKQTIRSRILSYCRCLSWHKNLLV